MVEIHRNIIMGFRFQVSVVVAHPSCMLIDDTLV
jgi:hypothetical protein